MFRNGRFRNSAILLAAALATMLALPSTSLGALQLLPNFRIDLGGNSELSNDSKLTDIDTLDFDGTARAILPFTPAEAGGGTTLSVGDFITVQGLFFVDSIFDGGGLTGEGAVNITPSELNPASPGAGGSWATDDSGTGFEITALFETRVKVTAVSGTFGGGDLDIEWDHDPTSASFLEIYLDGDNDGTGVFGSTVQADETVALGFDDGILALKFTDTDAGDGEYDIAGAAGTGSGRDFAVFDYDDDPGDIEDVFLNQSDNDITKPLPAESDPILKAVITSALLGPTEEPGTAFVTNFESIFSTTDKVNFFTNEDGFANLVPEASSYAVWGMLIVGGLIGNVTRRRRKSQGE